ncbi:MAG: Cell division protein FtsZ [Alphaproteobacteria bacterium MarineAlpha9_Bin4]|nr:cell division protein FtsZ [Pelagibacterales bacterium]PPR27677.1 MAG: Cell division protein FtsZ [Alphaproteobacteria bacterium MarineAlpha9_Bin4]
MTINLTQPTNEKLKPRITVIGVGGAGCNAVNNMIEAHLEGVEFLVANTDAQSLANSLTERRVQLGAKKTRGLGAGAKPEVGREAADESLSEVMDQLEGTHMLFVTAGMGGGTGTGAAPIIAEASRERGILTVGVVTKPFDYEGMRRMKIADEGIKNLAKSVDTLIIIPNQNLFKVANKDTTFTEAFKMADEVLYNGIKGVTDLIVRQGKINLDFADIQTVMLEMGKAMMGTGEASGEDRAIKAAEFAIANPLLDDTSISNAKGVIINISGEDVKLYEMDEIAAHIKQQCKEDVNLIIGHTIDNVGEGIIRVSLLASGINNTNFSIEADDTNDSEISNKFLKPRLVSIRKEEKNRNLDEKNTTSNTQSDLEDFLAKENVDNITEEKTLKNNTSHLEEKSDDFFIPQEEVNPKKPVGEKVDPFKEADLLNANINDHQIDENTAEDSSSVSLISRLSNVKNKAINVGTKAFSMVSEVANKSFDSKNENTEEINKTIDRERNLDVSNERIEPSFLDNNSEEKSFNSPAGYDDVVNSSLPLDENKMSIPSFLRRNRD